jgi:hypothetical protein
LYLRKESIKMTMEAPTRRSSRRTTKRSYSVGDIVEVHEVSGEIAKRNKKPNRRQRGRLGKKRSVLQPLGEDRKSLVASLSRFTLLLYSSLGSDAQKTTDLVLKARLLSKLAETSSALNPRWLVSFEEEGWTEQELYESSFGEIVGKVSPKKEAETTKRVTNGRKNSRKRQASPENTASTAPASDSNSSRAEEPSRTKKKRKTVSFAPPGTEDASDASSDISKKAAAASAREERSRRRQAVLEEQQQLLSQEHRRNAHNSRGANRKNGRNKDPALDDEKDVVRVPMLTGTLFLYKGQHRRAEFVRNV